MKIAKKMICLLLAVLMCFGLCATAGAADEKDARVVLGANLTDAQIEQVYKAFGIKRGDAEELTVTNAEERDYLEGVVSDSTIGTRSISCVYIQLLSDGKGLDIGTDNIDWCTKAIYTNALTTAGIDDAKVVVAAPFQVSGTAALTGIYKAYEDMTGKELSTDAKAAAVEELVVTSDIADQIGDADATEVVNQLKLLLDETADMTDAQLHEQIIQIADQCNVELTESQISQLINLVRNLEKLDVNSLIAKVQGVQDTVAKLAKAGTAATGFFAKVSEFFSSIGDFFTNLFKKK